MTSDFREYLDYVKIRIKVCCAVLNNDVFAQSDISSYIILCRVFHHGFAHVEFVDSSTRSYRILLSDVLPDLD